MWNAIKSDLVSFVSTVKDDAVKAVNKVIGDNENEEGQESLEIQRQQRIIDLTRSFNTYANPIEDKHKREFKAFVHKFSLASKASEIASILDQEADVARYYAELVPVAVPTADEFWARYFFRFMLIDRTGVIDFDDVDDDEENMEWSKEDDEDDVDTNAVDVTSTTTEKENLKLKAIIKSLTAKINDLEKTLAQRDKQLRECHKREKLIQNVADANTWKRPPVAVGSTEETTAVAVADPTSLQESEPGVAIVQTPSSGAASADKTPFEVVATPSAESVSTPSPVVAAPQVDVRSAIDELDDVAEEEDEWV